MFLSKGHKKLKIVVGFLIMYQIFLWDYSPPTAGENAAAGENPTPGVMPAPIIGLQSPAYEGVTPAFHGVAAGLIAELDGEERPSWKVPGMAFIIICVSSGMSIASLHFSESRTRSKQPVPDFAN
jgi:hypothetical protein